MPHGILDVVAEHPQEQHVAGQMKYVAVEEHVGDQRRPLGTMARPSTGTRACGAEDVTAEQLARHDREARDRASLRPLTSRGSTSTLTAISPTVTYWKGMDRSGLSSAAE